MNMKHRFEAPEPTANWMQRNWNEQPNVAGSVRWRIVKTRVNPAGIFDRFTRVVWPQMILSGSGEEAV